MMVVAQLRATLFFLNNSAPSAYFLFFLLHCLSLICMVIFNIIDLGQTIFKDGIQGGSRPFFQFFQNDSCFISIRATFETQKKLKFFKIRNNTPLFLKSVSYFESYISCGPVTRPAKIYVKTIVCVFSGYSQVLVF